MGGNCIVNLRLRTLRPWDLAHQRLERHCVLTVTRDSSDLVVLN